MLRLLKNLDSHWANYLMVNLRRHQQQQVHRSSTLQVVKLSTVTTTWRRCQLTDMIMTYLQHLDRHRGVFHEKHLWVHHRCSHSIETLKDQRTRCRLQLLLISYL